MNLGKEFKRIAGLAAVVLLATGCRFVSVESLNSATKGNEKLPYEGDPYTWGGIQEGTGGLVAATKQTMETSQYSEPKFLVLASPDAFISMGGWALSAAKPNDRSGDWQPLSKHDSHGGGEGHGEEGH